MLRVSVVVPFFDAANTLAQCLAALRAQSLARDVYEVIAVDDGSTDGGGEVAAAAGVRVVRQANRGAPAARNAGIAAAAGEWVAFTDADCIPSRGWLHALLAAVEGAGASATTSTAAADPPVLGAAGPLYGHDSRTPAARFVDLARGLDTERHLAHPRFPFAPSGNVMYRRAALAAVGGFDERYASYDACDLHTRLRRIGGAFVFERAAVVLHRHRATWRAYWRQQIGYGRGLAQFYLRWLDDIPWSAACEARAWAEIVPRLATASLPAAADAALIRRGTLVKDLAQRIGFVRTYYRAAERARWRDGDQPRPWTGDSSQSKIRHDAGAGTESRVAR